MKRCPECGFRAVDEERVCPLCGVRLKADSGKQQFLHSHSADGEACMLPNTNAPKAAPAPRQEAHRHDAGERCALPNREEQPTRGKRAAQRTGTAGSRWIGILVVVGIYVILKCCGA